MSAMAPAGIAMSIIGSISAICTTATWSAEKVLISEQARKPDAAKGSIPEGAARLSALEVGGLDGWVISLSGMPTMDSFSNALFVLEK